VTCELNHPGPSISVQVTAAARQTSGETQKQWPDKNDSVQNHKQTYTIRAPTHYVLECVINIVINNGNILF
jgi:hypothetical protein